MNTHSPLRPDITSRLVSLHRHYGHMDDTVLTSHDQDRRFLLNDQTPENKNTLTQIGDTLREEDFSCQ